jgi:hypothetical protein
MSSVKRFLLKHPLCCFCGGNTVATTMDHVPARIMFWGRRRPRGLEVPACEACNGGTRQLEQFAAIFARVGIEVDLTPAKRAEFRDITRHVDFSFPGWRREMLPDEVDMRRAEAIFGGAAKPVTISCLAKDAFYTTGAKLAFALHYNATHRIIASDGAVVVYFSTNEPGVSGIPDSWFNGLGEKQALRQGKWTTEEHFSYHEELAIDGSCSRFVCRLGEALSFTLFVWARSGESVKEDENSRIFRPGDFQRIDSTVRARYLLPLPFTCARGIASASLGFYTTHR